MGEHWKTIDEDAGLWLATYPFNKTKINTVAVRIQDGGLMILSPGLEVSDASFAELDAIGPVTALVSPGPFHHLGLPGWKARYPDARLFATTGGLARIPGQHKGLDLGLESIDALQALLPDSVYAVEMPDQKHNDLFVAVTHAGQTTWFTNEVLANMAELPPNPLFALLFKWTKSAPGLRVNTFVMKLIGAKKPATKAFFDDQLAARAPSRLLPCHGDVVDDANLPALLRAEFDRAF